MADTLPRPLARATGSAPALGGRAARAWAWTTAGLTAGSLTAAAVLAPHGSVHPAETLAWLLFVGSSVHVAATGWLYTLADVRSYALRRRGRYAWVPAVLVGVAAAVAAVAPDHVMAWLLLPYFAWQFFHYQKQNLGMTALAASSRRLTRLSGGERRVLLAAGWAGIVGLIARPGLLQLAVPMRLGGLSVAATAVFAATACAGVLLLARRPASQRPASFCAVYLVSLLFPLPIFVFGSPYAAVGGMTLAHGVQYLVLVGMVAAGSGPAATRVTRLTLLAGVALTGGVLLSVASHLHGAGPALRLLFGAYLGVVMSHFVVDAGLWRLRDPWPRAFLARRVPALVPAGTPVRAH